MTKDGFLERLDATLRTVIEDWFRRVDRGGSVEDGAPEIKCFLGTGLHRIKFASGEDLDVTYGLGVIESQGEILIESSVNNKSSHFDFDAFVRRLASHYWSSRTLKPVLIPDFESSSFQDFFPFEPVMGKSVHLEARREKADIIRLHFGLSQRGLDLLDRHESLFRELVEEYCMSPLKRIYAESYRERPD